jgi:hypothetical protein
MAMNKTYPVMNGSEPAIVQPCVNGWSISWNPDDGRWYVEIPGEPRAVVATFKERHNAMQYARTHEVPPAA